MRSRTVILAGTVVAVVVAGGFVARSGADSVDGAKDATQQALPKHEVPRSKDGNLVVALCDGETSMEVEGVKDGETMPRDKAQSVADQLMAEWRRKNPDANWDDAPAQPIQLAQAGAAPASNAAGGGAAPGPSAGAGGAAPGHGLPDRADGRIEKPVPSGDTNAAGEPGTAGAVGAAAVDAPQESRQSGIYSAFTSRDEKVWMVATDEFVKEGHRVFHDAKAVGGTIGVSCDMCHPDAANTHPETYPKFQVQLGRVAMLRDMINWCIENPARGVPLPDGDVRMKAMEAYILASRKGVALDYGKH